MVVDARLDRSAGVAIAGSTSIDAAAGDSVHRPAGCGTATRTAGSARGSSGIASIATVIAVHTACRTPGARVRATVRMIPARAAAIVARRDASARTVDITPYLPFFTRFASFWISSADSTFSSTMPTRNCSTDPDQKRLMICRTAPAATRWAGIAAS